jgi:hypothetical protein
MAHPFFAMLEYNDGFWGASIFLSAIHHLLLGVVWKIQYTATIQKKGNKGLLPGKKLNPTF